MGNMFQLKNILKTITALLIIPVIISCQNFPIGSEDSGKLAFALIGDNPYVDFNEPKYDLMIEKINAHPNLSWVVHLGDVKGGGLNCSDEVLISYFDLNQKIKLPFILTPGDNDWFDCSRRSAGGWDRMERLDAFRKIFYPVSDQTTGSQPFKVVSQADSKTFPDFVENVRWNRLDVEFGTVHLVGMTPGEGGEAEHKQLMEAAIAWIDEIFTAAAANDSKGVFIATQVDPYIYTVSPYLLKLLCKTCSYVRPGYEALDQRLRHHAKTFTKPIVLAVGDTHIFRVDKPLYDGNNVVEHFTRVEGFGHPNVHWVRIVVNPDSSEVFEIHQELIEENYGVGWNK